MTFGLDMDLQLDIEDVVEGFDGMSRRGRDLRRVWADIAPALKVDIRENFTKQTSPRGMAWPPPAAATEKKHIARLGSADTKKSLRSAIRMARGRLGKIKTSFSIKWGAQFLRWRSKVPFSEIHDKGGIAGQGAKMPKREFADASRAFLDITEKAILDFVGKPMGAK